MLDETTVRALRVVERRVEVGASSIGYDLGSTGVRRETRRPLSSGATPLRMGPPPPGSGGGVGSAMQTPLEQSSPLPHPPQLRLPPQPSEALPHSRPRDWQVAGMQPPAVIHAGVETSSAASCDDHTAQALSSSLTSASCRNEAPSISVFSQISTGADLDVVGLGRNVGGNADRVPDSGFIWIGRVGAVKGTVSYVHHSVASKADGNRGFGEVVEVSGADGHQAIEVSCRGASFELEVQSVDSRLGGLAAPPTVARADIRVGSRAQRGADVSDIRSVLDSETGLPWAPADLADGTGCGEDGDAEQ